MRMKKVLVISHTFPPAAGSGTLRILKFIKYLPENGWLPYVLSIKLKYSDKIDYTIVKEIPEGIRVFRTSMIIFLNLIYFYNGKRKQRNINKENKQFYSHNGAVKIDQKNFLYKIRKSILGLFTTPDRFIGWLIPATFKGLWIINKEKIDVIYSSSPCISAHLIACLLKKITRRSWVADFRDPWFKAQQITGFRRKLEDWLELQIIKNAEKIIANTEYLKNLFIAEYGDILQNKICVITNGYDPEDFYTVSKNISSNNIFTISHVGEFYEYFRTPDNFLIAIAGLMNEGKIKYNELRINLVGGGEYVYSQKFNNLLNRLNLNGALNIIQHISHRQSIQYMLDSNVLLLLQPDILNRTQIPAKAFEYIRSDNYILALAPDSATSDLIQEVCADSVINPNDIGAIKNKIYELFVRFKKTGSIVRGGMPKKTEVYDRRLLTKCLSGVFSDSCK